MVFKLIRMDSDDPPTLQPLVGRHVIGRGKFLQNEITDKRVSRNHAVIEATADALILQSLHHNPCFYLKKDAVDPEILEQNTTVSLGDQDKFGLIPDNFWYEIVNCPEEPANDDEDIEKGTEQENNKNVKVNGEENNSDVTVNGDENKTVIGFGEENNTEDTVNVEEKNTGVTVNKKEKNAEITATDNGNENNTEVKDKGEENNTEVTIKKEKDVNEDVKRENDKDDQETPSGGEENQNEEAMGNVEPTDNGISENEEDNEEARHNVESMVEELIDSANIKKENENNGEESDEAEVKIEEENQDEGAAIAGPSNAARSPKKRNRDAGADPACAKKAKVKKEEDENLRGCNLEDDPDLFKDPIVPLRERCFYGEKCYRRNPEHMARFSHPKDDDWGENCRGVCPYGRVCRRPDPRHWDIHDHPVGARPPDPEARGRAGMQMVHRDGNIFYIKAHSVYFYDDHFQVEDSDGESVDYDYEF